MTRFGNSVSLWGCIVGFVVPGFVAASVWISEIHYNPTGSDSGYEWVEWYAPDGGVDLEEYSFREQGVNHRLSVYRGGFTIGSGERIVVVDNGDKFLQSFPDYQGTILDSSFSLNNSGELLEILDGEGNTVFSVTYDPASGGDGTGTSIGLVDDVWYNVDASPGATNTIATDTEPEPDAEDDTESDQGTQAEPTDDNQYTEVAVDNSPTTYIEIKNPEYSEKTIRADAGGDRVVMAGAAYWFSGRVFGMAGGPVENPTIRWNWGDGSTGEGPRDRHTYRFPGEYTLTMSASVHRYTSRDRVKVTVIPPSLLLGVESIEQEDVVTIVNQSQYTLELSGYVVEHNEQEFSFPDSSFINPGQTLYLDGDTSGFGPQLEGEIALGDAYGENVDQYDTTLGRLESQVVQAQATQDTASVAQAEDRETTKPPAPGGTHSVVYASLERNEDTIPDKAIADSTESRNTATQAPSTRAVLQEAQIGQSGVEMTWQLWVLATLVLGALGLYLRQLYIDRQSTDTVEGFTITDEDGEKML